MVNGWFLCRHSPGFFTGYYCWWGMNASQSLVEQWTWSPSLKPVLISLLQPTIACQFHLYRGSMPVFVAFHSLCQSQKPVLFISFNSHSYSIHSQFIATENLVLNSYCEASMGVSSFNALLLCAYCPSLVAPNYRDALSEAAGRIRSIQTATISFQASETSQ